ncbi:MAG: ATP-binding cassette domain-containing protein, partial [bacterium]
MNIISINNLIKDFSETRAVDNLSFNVKKGTITGLLGPNGAGKTTTIQMILDLVTPTKGSIEVFGLQMKNSREDIL